MVPEPGVMVASLTGAGLGAAILLLVTGIRGSRIDPTRPPPRWRRALKLLRGPAATARSGLAVTAGFVVLVLTRWPVAAAATIAVVLAGPYLFGGTRAEQAQIARLDALAIWTESLRDTVTASASLEQAIPASTTHAPLVIRPALERLSGQIRVQTPLDAALIDLAADLDDPSADRVVAALILSVRRRGDQLALVLTGLVVSVREDLDLQRRITAGRAELRRGVQIVAGITLVFAGYLSVFGGAFLDPYDTPAGQVALAVVVGLFAVGFLWMRHLAVGAPTQPFLARPGYERLGEADQRVVAALTGPATDTGGARILTASPRVPKTPGTQR